jgi:hypothetical protein
VVDKVGDEYNVVVRPIRKQPRPVPERIYESEKDRNRYLKEKELAEQKAELSYQQQADTFRYQLKKNFPSLKVVLAKDYLKNFRMSLFLTIPKLKQLLLVQLTN